MTHDHDHDEHNHAHLFEDSWQASPRYYAAAAVLFVFSGLEAFLGSVVIDSPLVVADAGHNASDALFALAVGSIGLIAKRWRTSHAVDQHFRPALGIVISVATVLMIGYVVWEEAVGADGPTGAAIVLTAVLGGMSYLVNIILARYIDHDDDESAKGTAQHFRSDAKVSLLLIPTAVFAGVAGLIGGNDAARLTVMAGAVVIIALTAKDNGAQAWTFWRKLQACRRADRLEARKELR